MDPNQRQILEVTYECLENAGIPLTEVNNAPVACLVGSYACDYATMHARDPEDRPDDATIGVGRCAMANRVSHFLNAKGPSMAIDTACSASLVSMDVAVRYLHSGEVDGAIVATSNLFLNPEHVMELGGMRHAHSPTGLCHTFDADADGYVKAEAVSAVYMKRLSDAIRDRNPIRAVVLGTSTNSDGWTPGLANPNAEAQAAAIRAAYADAGITDFNGTAYLECHGTGTPTGGPTEIRGASSVFSENRPIDRPLIIGSIKGNIGHSEPSAGISGVIKAVMATEQGIIPGNPAFKNPNPAIDFHASKVKVPCTSMAWPIGANRRASVSSFGFGGSNAHLILEQRTLPGGPYHVQSFRSDDDDLAMEEVKSKRPYVLVASANDETSLRANIKALCDHLVNPQVKVDLSDIAYTLAQRRTRFWHRSFVTTHIAMDLNQNAFTMGEQGPEAPRIGFIFTGQGAQWPQMGKDLLEYFPSETKEVLKELDDTLQSLPDAPEWSLLEELTMVRTAEHLRQPEFSQPLVTALQLCLLRILRDWGVEPQSVVGHSSGEIAAACAAGFLNCKAAIKASYYRGRAARNKEEKSPSNLTMLAVGLGEEKLAPYLEEFPNDAWIACYNSPQSVTVSGKRPALGALEEKLKAGGHFVRLLQVDLAYHSPLMDAIGEEYETLLAGNLTASTGSSSIAMFSSVTGEKLTSPTDTQYWKSNMVSPVRFETAMNAMLSREMGPNFLIEIGPSGALGGPVKQTLQSLPHGSKTAYFPSWSRGTNAGKALFDLAGHLFNAGSDVDLGKVNHECSSDGKESKLPRTITDLPNYAWNHSAKHWHESFSSKEWRFKKFVNHDLLGSKVIGTTWQAPTWRKVLRTSDLPWLRDHMMGDDIVVPGAVFITMAIEAMYQKTRVLSSDNDVPDSANDLAYRLRDIRLNKALVLEEDGQTAISLTLSRMANDKHWHEFRVSTQENDIHAEHCSGLIRVQEPDDEPASAAQMSPLESPTTSRVWYKAKAVIGYGFGPAFHRIKEVESVSGTRQNRSLVDLKVPDSKWAPQSSYPLHPVALDGCIQAVIPSMWAGEPSAIKDVLVLALIDDLVINRARKEPRDGLVLVNAEYCGRGRLDDPKSYLANFSLYDTESGALLAQMKGLHAERLDVLPKDDPHTFDCLSWKPEINSMTQANFLDWSSYASVDGIIDLVAHKTPVLSVLEIDFNRSKNHSVWFSGENSALRSVYDLYDYISMDAEALVGVQSELADKRNAKFHLFNAESQNLHLSASESYDLVILKHMDADNELSVTLLRTLGDYLTVESRILAIYGPASSDKVDSLLSAPKFECQLRTPEIDGKPSAALYTVHREVTNGGLDSSLAIARFTDIAQPFIGQVRNMLKQSGWDVEEQTDLLSSDQMPSAATILVLDEAQSPVLDKISMSQWNALKALLMSGKNILWVTQGSQYQVVNPNASLAHGLFRTARGEDSNVRVTVLDVERSTGHEMMSAISSVLNVMGNAQTSKPGVFETEYVERGGILYIHRVIPDALINDFRRAEAEGLPMEPRRLHATKTAVQMQSMRVGTLESLTWVEKGPVEEAMAEDRIEVEVVAAGVNFKDVAVTMGIVPEDEHAIGYEGAGVITRLGPKVTKFKVGDRVCWMHRGSFANRLQVHASHAHAIPDWMSYEDAATIPTVGMTAVYALIDIANLKKGQSVLIHSAAGGVGNACIQLAKYKEAEIYVTVGTPEKRKFLEDVYGIPPERIFDSRNARFASAILRATEGKGIDVIVNTLIGELLDATWRIIANNGIMVEIGTQDIQDRSGLSMEPFERGACFRAFNLSHSTAMVPEVIERLLDDVFAHVEARHLTPIHPVKTFGFDNIPSALSCLRSGRHIGKVIIKREAHDVQVQVRPAIQKVHYRPDLSYLIVGGLRGLCGSLAIFMARQGAKTILVLSRSGIKDTDSQNVVRNCAQYGCSIVEAKGDVTNAEFVRRVFKEAKPMISGIIQGAMVLRDKPYEMMTIDDYQEVIYAKVAGTWNLHQASLEQTRGLDFFTLLSSSSGVVGWKGQANYAAANTFLDAFAHYRCALGLCANSVDLGVVQDVGYVAQQDNLAARFDPREWPPVAEGLLRRIFSYSVLQQDSGITPISPAGKAQLITGIGFPLPKDSGLYRDARFAFLFQYVASKCVDGGAKPDDDAIEAFRILRQSGDRAVLINVAIEVVTARMMKILRLETAIDPVKPLMNLGLDSLAAVELRNWIRFNLGAEMTTLDITNASSVTSICDRLVSKLPAAN